MLKRALEASLYVLMLGPPHAIRIHAQAQGKDHELNGVPLWTAVLAEFMLRMGVFIVLASGFQSAVSNEVFRLFRMDAFFVVVCVAGLIHTLIYTYCFAYLWSRRKPGAVFKRYRVLRNLVYSVIPGLLAAGLVLAWQQYNQIELFHGQWVALAFLSVWAAAAVFGLLEALLLKRMPHGIDSSNVKNRA